MSGLYDGTIASIPGLGGFVQQNQLNDAQTAKNLGDAATVMQLIKGQKQQQEEDRVREALQSGGTPEQVVQRLVMAGPTGLQAAQHYVAANQALASQKMLQGLDMTNPDALDRAGAALAMSGHPAAGAMTSLAEKMRVRQANVDEHNAQVSQVAPITAMPQTGVQNGVVADRSQIAPGGPMVTGTAGNQQTTEPVPPEVLAAALSGRPFSVGVGPSANPAENIQRTGGLFSQFYNSPISVIRQAAPAQQAALDASNPQSISPQNWQTQATQLSGREASLANAQALGQLRSDTTIRGQDIRQDTALRGQDMNRQNIQIRMGMNPDGSLNATGEARAQLIAAGKLAAGPQDRFLLGRVQEINPNWSNSDYQVNVANEKAFTSGKKGDSVRSFNVAIDHLDTLGHLADALDNGDIQAVNKMGNFIASQTGAPAPTNFNAAKALVADEIVKAVVGASGALGDRETAQATLNAANSPAQLKGVIDTYQQMMSGQLRGLHQQYVSSGGKKDFNSFLSDESKSVAASHPAASASGNDVTTPDGVTHHFPSAAAAQGFRKAAGL